MINLPKPNRLIVAVSILLTGATAVFFLEPVSSQSKDPSGVKAGAVNDASPIHAKGRGFPRVSFEDGREITASSERDGNEASARQLASADFDSDGVPDLVTVDVS